MDIIDYYIYLVTKNGHYNGDPEYVYRQASAVWVKFLVDNIVCNNNIKNIKFDTK
jgi:hypothetical protein